MVTADHRATGGYRGIYVQTAGSGGSPDLTPGASDGIFVFVGSTMHPVVIGDLVKVTGVVSDRSGSATAPDAAKVTQISATATAAIERVGTGTVPAVTTLAATVLGSAREAFEGMLVRPSGTYKLVSSHNLQNFGELWTSAGSAMPVEAFETQAPATAAADKITADNTNARLLLDDGYSIRTDRADHPGDQPYFTKNVVVRNGDVVNFPAGGSVLSYDFGNWRLQPPTPLTDASAANLKPTFSQFDSQGRVIGNPAPPRHPPSAATSRSRRSTC